MRAHVTRTVAGVSLVLALVPLASGCVPEAEPAGTPGSTSDAVPATDDPRVDSLARVTDAPIDAAVADIDASVKAAMDATGTPGVAVAVVHGGETIFARGYGVRDLDTGAPVDENTVFAMASVSKSIGATVIARAIDAGVVTWDTPVQENLPSFALSDPWVSQNLTIADLYAHRSGLFEHAGDELEEIGYDRAQVLERLRLVPLEGFRTHYAYGNFDITAGAESVAAAAGEDWADLSQRLLYGPLGMTSTSSRFADLAARENRALGHQRQNGTWVVTPEQRQPDPQSPAGGVSSSVTDMAKWMAMVLAAGEGDDSFVSRAALLPAVTPQIMTGRDPSDSTMDQRAGFYGYGFNVTTTAGGLVDVNHSGAFRSGTGTTVKMLPAADLGIVVLSDGEANGVAEGVAGRFADIAQYGAQRRDWLALYMGVFAQMSQPMGALAGEDRPTDAAAPKPLDAYAGVYRNDYFGDATVTVVGDRLQLALGPTGRWDLSPWEATCSPSRRPARTRPKGPCRRRRSAPTGAWCWSTSTSTRWARSGGDARDAPCRRERPDVTALGSVDDMSVPPLQALPLELLRQRSSTKWRSYGDDVIPMFVAETDFPLAPAITAALARAVEIGDTGYTPPRPGIDLDFADFAERRWGWRPDPARIRWTGDVMMGVVEVLRAVTSPGDRVVVTPPVYPPFYDTVEEAGAVVERVPLRDTGERWELDLDGIGEALASGATAVLLCNPHNPTGTVHSRESLAELARLAARYGAAVVSDEIHAPLTFAPSVFTPFLDAAPEAAAVGYTVTSASKTYNLAGLKCAVIVTGSEENAAVVRALPWEVEWRAGLFGVIANRAAFAPESDAWLAQLLVALDHNRRLLADLLAEHLPLARYRLPEAGFLAWVDVSAYGWGDNPAPFVRREAKVALHHGPLFGTEGVGHVRINVGCAPEVLEDAIRRIGALVE